MNKISKKIVALATMAAFVLTLVPAAAFGAVSSSVEVQEKSKEITLSTGASPSATATVDITVGTGDAGSDIVLWVEKDNAFYGYADFGDDAVDLGGNWVDYGVVQNVSANDKKTVTITFSEAGTYKVCAGISKNQAAVTPDDLRPLGVSDEDGTIVVSAADSYVNAITVPAADTTTTGQNGGTIGYAGGEPNGIRSTEVVAHLTSVYDDGTQGASSEGKVLNVENPYSNFTISNANGVVSDENPIVADEDDNATFYVKATNATRPGTYTLTLTADNAEYRLSIVVGTADNEAATIETVDTGKTAVDYTSIQDWTVLNTVAQFTVKNADGDVLTPATQGLSGFTAFTANDSQGQNNNNVGIVSAPKDGENAVFKVVAAGANSDNFALQVVDASDLALGEYTVRVSLDNNRTADVTFTVARFGQAVDTIIEFTDENDNVVTEVVDNGTIYTAKILQVDENGLTREVAANMGYTGAALQLVGNDVDNGRITFTVEDDVNNGDNSLVGSTIGVWGFTTAYGQYAYGEVTVVDEANIFDYTLEFDSTNGPAGKDNTVGVTVVDADGDKVDVDGTLYVYLLDKSVEDANVYVAPRSVNVTDGEGKLTINSDKETDLEIVVGVRNSNNVIFANTLNYTVGAQDPDAETTVVMTIGSTDYVVNNDIVTGDAAPYVDSAWRTMVPFRVLGETFGATVHWDQDSQTVTYTLGDTELTMTIGEETYTVNGDEKTMDTAPVLSGDRTFVPVRFVAEALGYTVVPLQDANGLTASVVFQK